MGLALGAYCMHFFHFNDAQEAGKDTEILHMSPPVHQSGLCKTSFLLRISTKNLDLHEPSKCAVCISHTVVSDGHRLM